jgi:glycosyltransferase involved in cell wall biosynthesis
MSVAVSVIVPVRNGEQTIGACLRSILALDIRSAELEILVVDNGSSDGTAGVVQVHPVRYLRADAVRGSYYARNEGARAASSAILAFTDADCEVDPGWLRAALPRFADPGVGLVAGRIASGPTPSRPAWYQARTDALNQERTLAGVLLPYALTANCIVRRDALLSLNGFDESLRSGGDADLCWRMQIQARWAMIYEPGARVVHHHRSTWKGVFQQTLTHARGLVALEAKHRSLFVKHGLPLRGEQGALRALSHTFFALGGRSLALLGAGLTLRPDAVWRRFGDLVCSAAFHAAVCGHALGVAR